MSDYTDKLEVGTSILVPYSDHEYEIKTLVKRKAVYNQYSYRWYEYAGEEYLEEGEEVHTVWVAG